MIYLFDKEEQLIKVVRRNAIKSALQKYALTTDNYVSDRLTVEMKALNDDEFEKVEFMAIQSMENTHLFHYFYIAQKSTKGEISTFTGVQSGIEELRKTPVFDKRPKNTPAKPVINELLQGTNWQARFVADTTNHSTNFYYTSVFDALKKLCKVWGLEMQFFVEMNSNGLGARYIDFKKKIGEAVGKRVVYGHNALEILKEVERTNIFTALIGRGKGEQVSSAEESGKGGDGYGRKITFEDVVWSKAKGDPLDKPKGQKYLEIPEMTRTYGIKNSNGTMRPKIGFTDFNEEEDPNELIKLTYQTLINSARPQLTLKTSSVYLRGVKIGDTIRVVRHDKKLDYDTRIFEITFNRLNDQSSDIKLGDQIGESSSSKVQAVADKAVEEFINNEFNSFIENLPDFIKTADGYNTNWYSTEDPVKKYPKKVMINDIWYKPDPEHEGHKIMYRWTGEVWEEILRTYNEVSLREKIDQKFNELKQAMDQQSAKTEQQINDALNKSGLGKLADDAKRIAEQAKGELEAIKQQNQTAQNELTTFKTKVQADLDGKPSKAEVTELIDGVKEKFTTNIGLRNYVLGTGKPADVGNNTKLYTFSKDSHGWGTDQKLRLSFDYQAEDAVKKFRINRVVRYKNGQAQWDFAINNLTTGKAFIDVSSEKSGKYSEPFIWKPYNQGNPEDIESIELYLNLDEGSGNVQIKNLIVSAGTNETDWVPAPEDQEYLVTQAQAEFERTAQGLKTKLDTISTNFNPDGTTSEKFNRFLETKTAEGISRERAEFGKNYVAKNTYNEKISEIEQKFNQTDGQLTQFATYKNGLDGQYATITKELSDNKRAYSDFARTSDVFVQAFGTVGSEIASNISRMLLNDRIFQTEVGKYVTDDNNLIVNSMTMTTNTLINNTDSGRSVSLNDGVFDIKVSGATSYTFTGFSLPIYVKKIYRGETYTLGFKYRFKEYPDNNFAFNVKNHKLNKILLYADIGKNRPPLEEWQEFQQTFTVREDFAFGEDRNFPFYIYLVKNGWVEFKEPILVRGSNTGPYKPSQFDDAYKASNEAKSLASDAQAKAIQVAQGTEAVRTQVTQLNNSYSIRSLTNAGDVLGQLNLNPDGSIRINEGLLSIGEKTYIKDGVIKKSMIGNAQIDTAHIKEIDASQANIFNLNVNNINGLNAEFIKAKIEYALVDWLKGKIISAINGKTVLNLNDGRLSFHDNNTGIFRDEANASSQGMMFLNNPISLGNRTAINSRVVIGADRRDNDVNRNWNRGGFNGMIVDTIRGTISTEHDNADKVTLVGDRIKFTHSYDYDPATNSNPYGWQINTWLDPTILPFGTNSRGSKIFSGDFKLLNKSTGTDGFWLREVLRTLINCWQHFANVNYTTAHSGTGAGRHNHTLNESLVIALRSELQKLQSYGV
ncbi:phage tail spike protein [Streptococcus parasanguinis]|uniref:phage tail spike protein n=1 Tax=Streptococcus parasanguinis TaxID=1318 RepID=UPI0009BB0F0C|nr:phage tail spike protein [Streptococcus parasanguinis]